MNLSATILLAFGMSMDAFAASIGKGATLHKPKFSEAVRTGLIFGAIETLTPLVGWGLGMLASQFILELNHWIAFILLVFLGGRMIVEGFRGDSDEACEAPHRHGFWLLVTTAFATSLNQLTLLRFLTGLGLGAAMPNAATLMSEYAPERRRALLVNLMFVGFPMGSSLGGFLSAWMIPHYGWQSVLVLGGVMPLLLAVALIFLLPESVRYLVVKQHPAQRIAAILRRIAPLPKAVEFVLREAGQVKEKSAIGVIFSPRYAVGTVMLCLTYFMGLLIFYLLTSWLPLLIRETGASMSQASIITALFPLGGGIGVLILGALMDKINPNKVVAVGWLLTGVFVCLVGFSTSSLALMGVMVFIAGSIMNGAQSSMPALAAGFYPTQGRATGVAWMLGIGRFGGILGAFSGAFLMQAQLSFETIFTLLAIPAFLSAIALLIKYRVSKSVPATTDEARSLQKA